MSTITVAQLRQNPTEALAAVEAGAVYRITRHNREIGRIIPPTPGLALMPAKRTGGMRLSQLPRHRLATAPTIDDLLADDKGDW